VIGVFDASKSGVKHMTKMGENAYKNLFYELSSFGFSFGCGDFFLI